MSRINGSDALKMFEAYAAVYASEEQVEEVAEDVEQLDEMGQRMTTGQSTAKPSTFKPIPGAGSAGGSGSGGRRGTPGASPGRLQIPVSNPPTASASAATTPTRTPIAATAAKSAATAAKPVAPSAGPKVAPAAAKPVAGTKAAGPESIKPKTPNPLLAGGDIQRMIQASKMRQSGINVTSGQLASAERTKPSTLKQSYEYDAYDLVLEYLLDNGHADTIDEAHYIMLEMDAQMIGDIVEGSAELSAAARKRAEELGRKRRSTKEYKQGMNRRTGRNERAAYNLSNIQRTPAANPSTQVSRSKKPAGYDTGAHKGDYERFNRSKPEKNPKHDANK